MEGSLVVAVMFACLGLALLVHHGWAHSFDEPSSRARVESSVYVGYFQLRDVAHLESWIVLVFSNAVCVAIVFLVFAVEPVSPGAFVVCVVMCSIGIVLSLEWIVLYFFCMDIPWEGGLHNLANHETWILVCWTNAVTLVTVEFSK